MDWDEYYLGIARAVSARGSCCRRKVGAVIVVNRGIVSTGYNGTPFGMLNCDQGGCLRCATTTTSGAGYDTCLCVHAEQNAISQAAARGIATEGGVLYCTLRPCFGCVKSAVQAGIKDMIFDEMLPYPEEVENLYSSLLGGAKVNLRQISVLSGRQ